MIAATAHLKMSSDVPRFSGVKAFGMQYSLSSHLFYANSKILLGLVGGGWGARGVSGQEEHLSLVVKHIAHVTK